MIRTKSIFNLAAFLALLNTIVHITGAAIAGFASTAMPIIAGAVIWLIFTIGFKANLRWMAYIAFLVALFGGIYVYATASSSPIPQWASMAIVLLDILIALVLFVLIWRRPAKQLIK